MGQDLDQLIATQAVQGEPHSAGPAGFHGSVHGGSPGFRFGGRRRPCWVPWISRERRSVPRLRQSLDSPCIGAASGGYGICNPMVSGRSLGGALRLHPNPTQTGLQADARPLTARRDSSSGGCDAGRAPASSSGGRDDEQTPRESVAAADQPRTDCRFVFARDAARRSAAVRPGSAGGGRHLAMVPRSCSWCRPPAGVGCARGSCTEVVCGVIGSRASVAAGRRSLTADSADKPISRKPRPA
jgi:hypothetical protein